MVQPSDCLSSGFFLIICLLNLGHDASHPVCCTMFALRDLSFLFNILILIPIWWLLISYRPYFTHLMSEIFTESTIDSSPNEWKGLKITLIQSGGSSFNLQGWSLFWHHAPLLPLSPLQCNPQRNLHFALCRFFPHELVLTCWYTMDTIPTWWDT